MCIWMFVGHFVVKATIGNYVLGCVSLCVLCVLCALCVCTICERVCRVFGWFLMACMMVVIGDRPS